MEENKAREEANEQLPDILLDWVRVDDILFLWMDWTMEEGKKGKKC